MPWEFYDPLTGDLVPTARVYAAIREVFGLPRHAPVVAIWYIVLVDAYERYLSSGGQLDRALRYCGDDEEKVGIAKLITGYGYGMRFVEHSSELAGYF